ncbi:MAG: hypothetical protein JNJ44_06750 [Zoogloeaceae bacterium]|nr:hypothetical protein [Zoogloeaceae bacterium]
MGCIVIGIEFFARNAEDLEHEIAKLGVVLGLDWADVPALRSLAREALDGGAGHVQDLVRSPDPSRHAKGELFAIAVMMLRVLEESAEEGIPAHGGPCWKAFGKALYQEWAARTGAGGVGNPG